MIEHGLGLQADTVPLPSLVAIGKAIYGDEIVYVVVLAVIKIAILVMYCRVFPLRRFRIAAWILGILTATWSLLFIFLCESPARLLPGSSDSLKAYSSAARSRVPGTLQYLARALTFEQSLLEMLYPTS